MNTSTHRPARWLTTRLLPLLCLCLAACTVGRPGASEGGYPDAQAQEALRQFQLPDGLFTLPEAATSRPSVAATAAVAALWDCADFGVLDWSKAAAASRDELSQLSTAYFHRVLSKCSSGAGAAGIPWESLEIPPVQEDVGAEVGIVATWARLRALDASVGRDDALRQRIAAIDPARLASQPYLIARLGEAFKDAGLSPNPAVTDLSRTLASRSLPPPISTRNLLDASAQLRAEAAAGRDIAATHGDYIGEVVKLLPTVPTSDSLTIEAILSVLEFAKPAGDIAAKVRRFVVDHSRNGMMEMSGPPEPSVPATYLVARLTESSFATIASGKTVARLRAAAADAVLPPALRAQALAALVRSGQELDPAQRATLTEMCRRAPKRVGQEALGDYISLMDAALSIDPDCPRGELIEFAAMADERSQKDAAGALRTRHVFSNADGVPLMFADYQRYAAGEMGKSDAVLDRQLGLFFAAMSGQAVSMDGAVLRERARAIREKIGCKDSPHLYSIDGAKDSPCSLINSLRVKYLP